MRKNYPLQIAISSLFLIITLALGGILSWQSFNKTSDIMLASAYELYDGIAKEFTLDFKQSFGSLAIELQLLGLSPVVTSKTFAERVEHLASMRAILDSDDSVNSVGIAYDNGDYFAAESFASVAPEARADTPAGTMIIVTYGKVDNSEPGFDAGKIYKIYYDRLLNEISRTAGAVTGFDPRQRPWYLQADGVTKATAPYVFYESKAVGLTVMLDTPTAGAVVAIDITLDKLREKVSEYQVTPSTEVVLINALGQTFAYKHQEKVLMPTADEDSLQLADLDQLGSGVLSYLSKSIEAKEQQLDFDYLDKRWIGSVRQVARPGGVELYVVMLSPVEELLADAIAIRWQLLFIALMVLLAFIPVVWFTARKISTPLQVLADDAAAISRFEFEESKQEASFIKEVVELDTAMESMKATINKFIKLINSLAGEQDLDALIKVITSETMLISKSDAALIYLLDETDDQLKVNFVCEPGSIHEITGMLPALSPEEAEAFSKDEKSRVIRLTQSSDNKLAPLLTKLGVDSLSSIIVPLKNRKQELIGLLCLAYKDGHTDFDASNIEFVEALSGFAAITLESRQLISMQEALLHAFIKLIAGAIDAKSPYTGGHCTRVPEITLMLAKAACDSSEGKFKDFDLDEKQWEELSIAGWLHDCGKVTTPEYVVDKATKLETIYDRIHEIRMRFEVLKRDAEIDYWQQVAGGGDKAALLKQLEQQCCEIDDDFAFVAECNVGAEFMADEKIDRLQSIAEKTWKRTLNDMLGLSWEEASRKKQGRKCIGAGDHDHSLPVEEKLLSDKPEHLIARHEIDKMPPDNQWGFKVDTPKYKYNRGELYNLSVRKGTLSEEERYMINGHMIQTIIMLNNLPYPKHLRNVPLIAGSHHETMDGKGYPKKLVMSEQPLTARMMVIADIFEALTAADRPYKKAKTLSESLRILSFMRDDKHIDADLFDLFLSSGVYLEYAKKFLLPEQIDAVDINDYMSS